MTDAGRGIDFRQSLAAWESCIADFESLMGEKHDGRLRASTLLWNAPSPYGELLLSAPTEIRNDYARLRRHLKQMFGGVQRIDWTASRVGASTDSGRKTIVALIDLSLATNKELLKVEQIGHVLASRLVAG